MQWKALDAARLEALSPKDRGERWLQTAAAAGVERTDGSAPPQQAMSALYAAAWTLAESDEALSGLRVTDRFHFYAPPGTWLLLPGAYILFIFLAAFRDDYSDRLLAFGALWTAAGAAAGGLLLWIAAATWSRRREKRARLDAARQQREAAARAVVGARAALLAQSFVLRVRGETFLCHAPRLRELEAQLRQRPEQATLRARRDAIRAALARHRSAPPAVWTDDGLS